MLSIRRSHYAPILQKTEEFCFGTVANTVFMIARRAGTVGAASGPVGAIARKVHPHQIVQGIVTD